MFLLLRSFFTCVLLLCGCSAPPRSVTPAPKKIFHVIGYFPSWTGVLENVAFDKLTQINYAFLLPAAAGDGSLMPLDKEPLLRKLVEQAHQHHVKVFIAVGGWNNGDDSAFRKLAADPERIQTFVKNMRAFCQQFNLDGVDIDWELPTRASPEDHSADDFLNLMQGLSAALHADGKQLSAAVVGAGDLGAGIRSEVFETVDLLGMMAYDGDNGAGHSPYRYAEASFDYWLGRSLPASKAILGIPFYSRPGFKNYSDLARADKNAAQQDTTVSGENYNGIPTAQKKTQLARVRGAGVMIWELSQDSNDELSLLRAIDEARLK